MNAKQTSPGGPQLNKKKKKKHWSFKGFTWVFDVFFTSCNTLFIFILYFLVSFLLLYIILVCLLFLRFLFVCLLLYIIFFLFLKLFILFFIFLSSLLLSRILFQKLCIFPIFFIQFVCYYVEFGLRIYALLFIL